MPGKRGEAPQKETVYSVSRITREIRELLESGFSDVWVEGEISNFKVYPSGHAYFSLKDEDSLLACVMFKGNMKGMKFGAEDGMKVLCRGHISVYDKRGQYQLYVARVELRGQGELQAAFERLKEKLFREGLFDEKAKKEIPRLPTRIGVVTSPAGAAIRDILNVARRRYSNAHITLRPVKVQGEGAAGEIALAIREFNEYNLALEGAGSGEHPVDVLIVGRGGGSLEDLWAFNEEAVARAIFASRIPVVSAVGHEIDYTISDLVADLRAATPSAAAEICVPRKEELARNLALQTKALTDAVRRRVESGQAELDTLKDSRVMKEPAGVIDRLWQQIDDLVRAAGVSLQHGLEMRRKDLGIAAGKLGALSPLAVLERGYSITFRDEGVVKDASRLKKGDRISTRVASGSFTSVVDDVTA